MKACWLLGPGMVSPVIKDPERRSIARRADPDGVDVVESSFQLKDPTVNNLRQFYT